MQSCMAMSKTLINANFAETCQLTSFYAKARKTLYLLPSDIPYLFLKKCVCFILCSSSSNSIFLKQEAELT